MPALHWNGLRFFSRKDIFYRRQCRRADVAAAKYKFLSGKLIKCFEIKHSFYRRALEKVLSVF